MSETNEELLRSIRANGQDSDPIVKQLSERLEGILDELGEALKELAEAKIAVDKAVQLLEDHTKENLPTEWVLDSLYTALTHLEGVKTALVNR